MSPRASMYMHMYLTVSLFCCLCCADAHAIKDVGITRRSFTHAKNTISSVLVDSIRRKHRTPSYIADLFIADSNSKA